MLLYIFLFINSVATGDWNTLKFKCTILLIIYAGVLLAMGVDLIRGLHRAYQRGELRTSYGLRRTVDKGIKYYSLIILLSIADIIASLVLNLPYFTMIGGLFVIGIEIKSWFEKASDKERRDIAMIATLLKNKENPVEAFAELIEKEIANKQKSKEDEKVTIEKDC